MLQTGWWWWCYLCPHEDGDRAMLAPSLHVQGVMTRALRSAPLA